MSSDNRKGYKAFGAGMICAPDKQHIKQYAEHTTYEEQGGKVCNEGMMHYCINPMDCLDHYPLIDESGNITEFAEVEAVSPTVTDDGAKYATSKLHIGAKLSLKKFIEASVDFVFERTIKGMPTSDSAQIGSSGYNAQIGSSGYSAKIASSGYSAQIGSSGYNAQIASSGDNAQIGSSGDNAQIGSSGYNAKIASSGYNAQIGSSGYSAKIASSGYNAKIAVSGDDSVAAAVGLQSCIRGKLGCWITLAEWTRDPSKERLVPVCVKSGQIDGEILKPDTWYKLEGGEFVEAEV